MGFSPCRPPRSSPPRCEPLASADGCREAPAEWLQLRRLSFGSAGASLSQRGHQRIQQLNQRWNMFNCHSPEPIMANFPVFVCQDVPLCLNGPPWNLRMSVLKFPRHAPRCLTDDLDLSFDCTPQQQIGELVFESTSRYEGHHRSGRRQHVPKIRAIIPVRRHKSLVESQGCGHVETGSSARPAPQDPLCDQLMY